MENYEQQKKYERAQKKVKDEKGFYTHLTVYLIINIFLLLINTNFSSQGMQQWAEWHFYSTPIFWGIGLFFHGLSVFNKNFIFSREWEDRKIKEIMNEDDASLF